MDATVVARLPAKRLSPSSTVLAVTATAAPASASLRAIASPIPRLAPVTTATLPDRGRFVVVISRPALRDTEPSHRHASPTQDRRQGGLDTSPVRQRAWRAGTGLARDHHGACIP